jgi:hypothetical protein
MSCLRRPFGDIGPDVRVGAEEIGTVLVEVADTHFVDEHNLAQIKLREIAPIEIDLSTLRHATFAALDAALIDDHSRTKCALPSGSSCSRSRIPSELVQNAINAIDDYLMWLSAAGALVPHNDAFFAIAVADLACFETLDAIRKDRN